MPEHRDVKYIGASIEDFIRVTSEHLREGKYYDGVTMPREVHEGLSRFVEALSQPTIKPRIYVFVWSTHIFTNVEHDVLSKP